MRNRLTFFGRVTGLAVAMPLALSLLGGCAAVVLGGAVGGGALLAEDRRTVG